MKIYGTYTQRFIKDGSFTENSSLNGYYDLSFFLDYPAYQLPTLTVKDGIAGNTFFIAEYDENVMSQENIDTYLASIPTEFNISLLTIEEARQYLTGKLVEITPGTFEISPAMEIMGQVIEAQYLVIS